MIYDLLQDQDRISREVKKKDRARLARAHGKKCTKCGGQRRVTDPETGLAKTCPKCKDRNYGRP